MYQVFEQSSNGKMEPLLDRERRTAVECFDWRSRFNEEAITPLVSGVYRRTTGGWEEVYESA